MSPEDVQHVLDRVRARMPVAASTMEAALEYIGERWPDVTAVRKENAKLKADITKSMEEARELKEEIEELKRERPVQSDDESEPVASSTNCRNCAGWGCTRCGHPAVKP
jgi:hypothetical protein